MAKDLFHDAVKMALEKDGWTITHDPLHIVSLGFNVLIDLGAERLIGASKGDETIAVEVKSFTSIYDTFCTTSRTTLSTAISCI